MPQRVSDEQLRKHLAGAWALLPPPGNVTSHDLALDLRDARAEAADWYQKFRDTSAALLRAQKALDERPVL